MKKLATVIVLALFVGFAIVSCKSHETCPAYGKKATQNSQDKI